MMFLKFLQRSSGVTVVDGQTNIRGIWIFIWCRNTRVLLTFTMITYLTSRCRISKAWSGLPVENIGQIEIIKGAASALYGSSAMNGIINVRTHHQHLNLMQKFLYLVLFQTTLIKMIIYDRNIWCFN